MIRTTSAIVVIITHLVLMGIFINFYMADVYFTVSKNELENGELKNASRHIIQALKLNDQEPVYYRHKAKILLTTLTWDESGEISREIISELEKAEELNPKNLATLRNIIPLYYFLAADDQNNTHIPITRNYYNKLKDTYENDLGIYSDVAKYEKRLGLEEYDETREKAEEMRSDIVDWHGSFN